MQMFTIDRWFKILGSMTKGLFVAIFASIILVLLVAAFGAGELAINIFWVAWAILWRAFVTLMALIAMTTMVGIWSPNHGDSLPSMLQQRYSDRKDNVIHFQRPYCRSSHLRQKPRQP